MTVFVSYAEMPKPSSFKLVYELLAIDEVQFQASCRRELLREQRFLT